MRHARLQGRNCIVGRNMSKCKTDNQSDCEMGHGWQGSSRLLLRVECRGLHLLWVVVGAVRTRCHHASHPRNGIARLSIVLYRRRWVKRGGIHVVCHAVLLVSHHVGRASRCWWSRRRRRRRSRHRHNIAGLLSAGNEHWHHAGRGHVLGLSAILGIVVSLWHKGLWLEARLRVRLECGSVDGSFGNVGCAG